MSALEDLAKDCGSLRYARDLIESSGQVRTRPWWHVSRPMTGLFSSLTAEQRKRALAYEGSENHGDPAYLLKS
jgi:hypothetical protein